MYFLPLLSLLHALASLASPASRQGSLDSFGPQMTKHAWPETPAEWTHLGPAPDSHTIRLRIGLKQAKIDTLIEQLYEVSDPAHERYGKYLSKQEVEDLVRPAPESVELVESWIEAHGIDIENEKCDMQRSPAGDWLTISVPVRKAEEMLDTEYGIYQHKRDLSNRVVRSLSYSLPKSLHDHVDVVTPTTMFGTMRSMKSTSFLVPAAQIPKPEGVEGKTVSGPSGFPVPLSCNTSITPTCLMDLYGTTGFVPKATDRNSIGIAGYLNEFASFTDLKLFTTEFLPVAINATFQVIEFNGGQNNQSMPGGEADLDVQTTTGLTFPTPNIYFSTGGSPPFIPDDSSPTDTNEPYDKWIEGVLSLDSIPPVVSTSYGDDEQTVPFDFAVRVCNSFAQFGARGTSLLFSSGDSGVGNGGDCLTNDGKNQTLFQPAFPASCPFVTTVGGTTQVDPEIAIFFSGGGFSRYFAQPKYQKKAVDGFLKTIGNEFKGLFNKNGRAYPDISAQAFNFQIFIGGKLRNVAGTSCSCPASSSIFTLLNDFRLSHGKPTLGFLNPLLYANPNALNDITIGSNPGCNTTGFTAIKGWDPVTGLGTPNFPKLQKVVDVSLYR